MGRPRVTRHPAAQGFGMWLYEQRNRVSRRWDRAVARIQDARDETAGHTQQAQVLIVRGHHVTSGRRVY